METQREGSWAISRRWTDELGLATRPGQIIQNSSGSDRTAARQDTASLRELYEQSDDATSLQDFEIVDIAREQLGKLVDTFNKEKKPSNWEYFGISHKAAKTKAVEALSGPLSENVNEISAFIDSLEADWIAKNGRVYAAFKKTSNTLHDHRTILKVFPSQNNYASPLVGSVTILMKAAKSHSEISLMLSKSIAEISEKVATCADIVKIVKTARSRRKLAEVYARMFQFYQDTIEWYLDSKFGRFVRSFNENLVKTFEDAKADLEASVNELYREAAVANTAMVAMINGKVLSLESEIFRQRRTYEARDILAGQRMQRTMQATWMEVKKLESTIQLVASDRSSEQLSSSKAVETVRAVSPLQNTGSSLKQFIICDETPPSLEKSYFWVAEPTAVSKLYTWMATSKESSTMWISSPYESGTMISSSRATAISAVSAAWQAETPMISCFCRRPHPKELRRGLSHEQVGLISLVYSLIRQLLQFDMNTTLIDVEDKDLDALDGAASSWAASLKILEELLNHVPVVTFCVIDGLNDFEWGNGGTWCNDLLKVLSSRQKHEGTFFNVLFATTGQSRVLPRYIEVKDRFMSTKKAVEVRKFGSV